MYCSQAQSVNTDCILGVWKLFINHHIRDAQSDNCFLTGNQGCSDSPYRNPCSPLVKWVRYALALVQVLLRYFWPLLLLVCKPRTLESIWVLQIGM